ncbi:MAG: hypothetical protein ACP5RS_01120 [Thermoplasmata archaeon]
MATLDEFDYNNTRINKKNDNNKSYDSMVTENILRSIQWAERINKLGVIKQNESIKNLIEKMK